MGEFSAMHWLVVLIIFLLLFGPSKLPGLGSSLGKAIRGFKEGLKSVEDELHKPEQSAASPTQNTAYLTNNPQNSQSQAQKTEEKNRS